jgi:hypothetical protein
MHCVSTIFDIAQALILNFLLCRLKATFYECPSNKTLLQTFLDRRKAQLYQMIAEEPLVTPWG